MHIFLVVFPSEARDLQLRTEGRYYVYSMASRSLNVYTGITDNVNRGALEHKSGSIGGFAKRYNINRLVYYETFRYGGNAIARGKQIKAWTRAKRVALIKGINRGGRTWRCETELQISRYAWDDNQFEHTGGAREVAALRFSETSELRTPRIED